ncbi:hypothetical protein FACS1894202_13980 [Clostridia bacterium]|nr:hypothetical protein FACS1894202_13980 [Clostridia bacterium]
MRRFWDWRKASNDDGVVTEELRIDGYIAEESWFLDEVTPAQFKSELSARTGNITVVINSGGGECFAAAQIYNMLREYDGKVTVKIDALAASAASVIACAGDEVLVSPVSMIMIHNPLANVVGEVSELERGIEMLNEVKESIINAYIAKTKLSRNKISAMMDAETWLNARAAIKLGFADGMLYGEQPTDEVVFDRHAPMTAVADAFRQKLKPKPPARLGSPQGSVSTADLYEKLNQQKQNWRF